MNFKIKLLIISLSAFVTFGCGDKKEKPKEETHQHKTESHEGHDHSDDVHKSHKEDVKPNEGKKWEVDEHTHNSMQKISQTAKSSYVKTLEEFNELGVMLQNEMKNLIAECTMQGEAHNQLHNYLTIIIPHIDGLVEAETKEDGEKHLQGVKAAVNDFYTTFE